MADLVRGVAPGERQIDHTGARIGRLADAVGDIGAVARAGRIQHLFRDDVGVGCDADDAVGRDGIATIAAAGAEGLVARGDGGNRGAVAVVVHVAVAALEGDRGTTAQCGGNLARGEGRMVRVDTRIDNRQYLSLAPVASGHDRVVDADLFQPGRVGGRMAFMGPATEDQAGEQRTAHHEALLIGL